MPNDIINKHALVVLAGAALLASACGPAPEPGPPNVLIIMTDQLNRKMLGCMGNPVIQTPSIDRLAAEGARFRSGYCNDPICGPSRYSMFTGLYPTEVGTFVHFNAPRAGLRFLPEYLNDAGYFTAHVGKTHFYPPLETHGFQELYLQKLYYGEKSSHFFPWFEREVERRGLDLDPHFWKQEPGWAKEAAGLCLVNPSPDDLTPEAWITTKSLAMMKRAQDEGRPFFVHASYTSPHHPYGPIQEYLDLYDPADFELPASFEQRVVGSRKFSEQEWRVIWHHYYAFVTQLDHHIGVLLDGLDELGLSDNTLVLFLSDHGDMLGEFSLLTKGWAYEGSLGVPFIARWPDRFEGGAVLDAPVSLIDVLPTLLDAAGVAIPERLRGETLLPLLDGDETGAQREVYAIDVRREPYLLLACRDSRWKLSIWNGTKGRTEYRLIDLEEDPDELVDLFEDPAARPHRDRLQAKLDTFWERESQFVTFPLPARLPASDQVLEIKE